MVVETREAKIGKRSGLHVDIPAQAEIQWVPAFAGMTTRYSAVADDAFAGMTTRSRG
jgi:hypothetical protein